jgi:hypothetical protein
MTFHAKLAGLLIIRLTCSLIPTGTERQGAWLEFNFVYRRSSVLISTEMHHDLSWYSSVPSTLTYTNTPWLLFSPAFIIARQPCCYFVVKLKYKVVCNDRTRRNVFSYFWHDWRRQVSSSGSSTRNLAVVCHCFLQFSQANIAASFHVSDSPYTNILPAHSTSSYHLSFLQCRYSQQISWNHEHLFLLGYNAV